jgi:hypothetical protein
LAKGDDGSKVEVNAEDEANDSIAEIFWGGRNCSTAFCNHSTAPTNNQSSSLLTAKKKSLPHSAQYVKRAQANSAVGRLTTSAPLLPFGEGQGDEGIGVTTRVFVEKKSTKDFFSANSAIIFFVRFRALL